MHVNSRRSLLAGLAGTGAASLLAGCSGVREVGGDESVQSISAPVFVQLKVRANETFEYDLTQVLAPFADEGNLITVVVGSRTPVLKAKVWLMRDVSSVDGPTNFVKRELLDYFLIEVGAAAVGTLGTISFTGYTGPNKSGAQVTQTISLSCDNSPPTRWRMGANTRGQFGGFPIHRYMPGNPQDWTVVQPPQFMILKDPKPRTELGSGRSYPNGYARLVLASSSYGGAPLVPPVPGTSTIVMLVNRVLGQSHVITVEFVAKQTDVAPWPAVDTIAPPESPTTQLGQVMRIASNFAYGSTFMLEEGDHLNGSLQIGFTTGFGTTSITGVAPLGCFAGDSKLYSPNPVYNDRLVTWRGRTPSTYADRLRFDLRSINRTSTKVVGFRFTRLKVGELQLMDGAGAYGAWDIACMDHLECVRLGSTSATAAVIDFTAGMNPCAISNWVKGQLNVAGKDFQIVGNRIETPANVTSPPGDSLNFTGNAFNSDDTASVATVAYNLWINKQGPDSPLHVDYFQGNNTASVAGTHAAMRFYGNVIHGGKRRISTGTAAGRAGDLGKMLPGGGECVFMFDWGDTNWKWEVAGNLIVESVYWGIGLGNPAAGTKVRHNMLLDDLANTNPVSDHDKPTIDLQATTAGWTAAQNGQIYVENNLQSQGYISQRGGVDAEFYSGNMLGLSPAWQTTNLVNPAIGGLAKDMADIETAFSFKPGVSIAKGPFHDRTLIDLRRHTADLNRLFA